MEPSAWWSLPEPELLRTLGAARDGLSSTQAADRLASAGRNEVVAGPRAGALRLAARQFASPLVLILVGASLLSLLAGEWRDALVVLAIVLVSAAVGFFREHDASRVLERLRARITLQASAIRDGKVRAVPAAELVPGDVILLAAGSLVPADARLLEATDFQVNQAVLTGETFPVEKRPGEAPVAAPIAGRTNAVFLGTNVRSGSARAVIAATGRGTAFGAIAERLRLRPPETEFDRGIRRFGYLLTSLMVVMVLGVFAASVIDRRPPVDSLLFAVALAVGLTPELLPAILSVNLGRSAREMAEHGVLVRRLESIENLGSMDVLCTDKTGTLTQGVVRLDGALDRAGAPSQDVLRLGAVSAAFQTGLPNPLDEAILDAARLPAGIVKIGEVPYDFVRKRLSVLVREGGRARIVTKGALDGVLACCPGVGAEERESIRRRVEEWGRRGFRVLGVASRELAEGEGGKAAERDLDFAGFLLFFDPPKEGVRQVVSALGSLGVRLKVITGDSRFVARHVADAVGIPSARILTGNDLDEMHEEALWHAAEHTDLFVEVDPNQKERIILALKKTGHVVGYMGDGINDAPALHAADVSLSVEGAVDVAKEAADFVLLRPDLDVLRRGIVDGRHTFANTLKYLMTTMSANLGNMLSMAIASLWLPFFPLLAKQILLNNFLSDVPALGLAGDAVDPEMVDRPRRWDMRMLRRFMIDFGIVSSFFDLLTFGLLLFVFRAAPERFRTAWFVESLLTELAVALVVRTRRPFWRSRPGRLLWTSSAGVALLTLALPYLPLERLFGFVPLPPAMLGAILAITLGYVAATELAKHAFFSRIDGSPAVTRSRRGRYLARRTGPVLRRSRWHAG